MTKYKKQVSMKDINKLLKCYKGLTAMRMDTNEVTLFKNDIEFCNGTDIEIFNVLKSTLMEFLEENDDEA